MYLFETGLGEQFKPRTKEPAKPLPKTPVKRRSIEGLVAKDGDRRFCSAPPGGTASCDLMLKIRFRRSFDEFLREVESAYGRWMERPTARRLIKTLQKTLKEWHQQMLYGKHLDNDPIVLTAGLFYRKSNGTWLVDSSNLRQYSWLIDI